MTDFYTRKKHIEDSIIDWQNLLNNTECPIANAKGYRIDNVYIAFIDEGNVYAIGVYDATTGEKKGDYRFNLETGHAVMMLDDRYTSDGWISACSYLSDIFGGWFGDPDERPFQLINEPIVIDLSINNAREYSDINELVNDLVSDILAPFRNCREGKKKDDANDDTEDIFGIIEAD
jgi:hypothetical protein